MSMKIPRVNPIAFLNPLNQSRNISKENKNVKLFRVTWTTERREGEEIQDCETGNKRTKNGGEVGVTFFPSSFPFLSHPIRFRFSSTSSFSSSSHLSAKIEQKEKTSKGEMWVIFTPVTHSLLILSFVFSPSFLWTDLWSAERILPVSGRFQLRQPNWRKRLNRQKVPGSKSNVV